MDYIIKCRNCEELFVTTSFNRRYCSDECRKKGKRKNHAAYQKESFRATRYKAKAKKKGKLTIEEICKRAKAEGLSYGKYVGKYGL